MDPPRRPAPTAPAGRVLPAWPAPATGQRALVRQWVREYVDAPHILIRDCAPADLPGLCDDLAFVARHVGSGLAAVGPPGCRAHATVAHFLPEALADPEVLAADLLAAAGPPGRRAPRRHLLLAPTPDLVGAWAEFERVFDRSGAALWARWCVLPRQLPEAHAAIRAEPPGRGHAEILDL